MAVGMDQGVAGLAPRPFTLEEETGSHHVFMFIAPARASACTTGAHLHLPAHRRSSIIIISALFMLFMLFMQLARSTLVYP